MNELIDFSPMPVKGHCRIELRDAQTGELTDVREGYNFISNALLTTLMKQAQKALFAGSPNSGMGLPPLYPLLNYGSSSNCNYDGMFRYLVLTDSALAESPTTENSIPGNVVGFASRAPYVGSDSKTGTINQAESFGDETKAHWVFDFATNVANGTINSVCWTYAYPEVLGSYMIPEKMSGTNISFLTKFVRIYGNPLTYGDGYFWAFSGTTVYKIDPATFQEVATYTLNSSPGGYICVRNGYLYYPTQSYYLRKHKLSDGTYVQSSATVCNYYNGGNYIYNATTVDDTYIYLSGTNYSVICRIKVSDLTLMDTRNLATPVPAFTNCYGLHLRGGVLYAVNPTLGIYSYDYVNQILTLVNNGIRDSQLFSDGTSFYLGYTENYLFNGSQLQSNTQLGLIADITAFKTYNLMARKLLGTPVVKTSAKTMKIIYEFQFS